jgi:hypothetical protein
MKDAAEMGSRAMMYIPSFIKIDSGIQKSIGGIHERTERMEMELTSFFQNKENRKIEIKQRGRFRMSCHSVSISLE